MNTFNQLDCNSMFGEDIFSGALIYRCCSYDSKDWCSMKRSQVDEQNCGHWEYEVQYPEAITLDQSSMPRSFGTTTTRRLRFLRASTRDLTAGMSLVEMGSRVEETDNSPQRARTDSSASIVTTENRRTDLPVVEADDKPDGPHDNGERVMGGVLDTTGNPRLDVHEDEAPGRILGVVDESSRAITSCSSPDHVSVSDTVGLQQNSGADGRDKENLDPLGERIVLPHRSPLPEWFPRRPLQDITNVLASDLDNEQPQPKKKRNKKMGNTQAPVLLLHCDTPVKSAPTITQPKPFSCAAPKHSYNLRKNFR